jgi:hypothetical protein
MTISIIAFHSNIHFSMQRAVLLFPNPATKVGSGMAAENAYKGITINSAALGTGIVQTAV